MRLYTLNGITSEWEVARTYWYQKCVCVKFLISCKELKNRKKMGKNQAENARTEILINFDLPSV